MAQTPAQALAPAESERTLFGHPRGLYALFFTEMWERFGFYGMLSLFVLYLRNPTDGFGWSAEQATGLYSNYYAFIYLSPLLGGWLADKKIGHRRAVMIGALFFMAGYALLGVHSLPMLYAALGLLVIGNGLFKPNVSTMVGNLYPEGSRLKDSGFLIFYVGINVGAFFGPIVMEFVKGRWGNGPAFTVLAFGMIFAIGILWAFRRLVEGKDQSGGPAAPGAEKAAGSAQAIDSVSDGKRVMALIVVFLLVIVFWMVYFQNGSTLTYWADENTDWKVSGTISNSINPFFIVLFTFPLIWFWKKLDAQGREPSTPAKMAIGMFLTAVSFFILWAAAKMGEATAAAGDPYAFKVSPAWLVSAYAVVTLGELMLSPMGLSLVSKVAPRRMRGLMMGAWFVVLGIGGKLTMIGVLWTKWLHSEFFLLLGLMALGMSAVLLFMIRPLKKAMPGV
jgi:POT family proton-dependent oligopeptide transporter